MTVPTAVTAQEGNVACEQIESGMDVQMRGTGGTGSGQEATRSNVQIMARQDG